MTLVKRNNEVVKFPGFSDLLGNFFGSDISDFIGNWEGTTPSVNISETKDDYRLEVAAPGMAKEDFDIKMQNDYLIISGKNEDSKEESKDKYHRREFHYSAFRRSFRLPEVVDVEQIEAQYHNGILLITLPKKEEVKKREEVKTIRIS